MWLRNSPNFLSALRIILSPFIPVLVIKEAYGFSLLLTISLALTDFLDGFLARKLKAQTTLGKFLDPLGDKVFTFFALFSYTFLSEYKLPFYIFFSLLLRDITLIVGGVFLRKYNFVPEPSVFGKITTFLVSAELALVAFLNVYYVQAVKISLDFLLPATLTFIWISFVHYLYKGLVYLRSPKTFRRNSKVS
ncbi:CDP-alcohol phosphatidyltransferase family protein [Aquifex sp.]